MPSLMDSSLYTTMSPTAKTKGEWSWVAGGWRFCGATRLVATPQMGVDISNVQGMKGDVGVIWQHQKLLVFHVYDPLENEMRGLLVACHWQGYFFFTRETRCYENIPV